MLAILWADMDKGGFSAALAQDVLRFNGKLFKGAGADGYSLLLTPAQIDLLIEAARANWREVEPAIFGTLLERALSPTERHALGRALHAARLCRAPGAAHRDRAAARRLGQRPSRRAGAWPHEGRRAARAKHAEAKLAEARAEVEKISPPPVHHCACSTRPVAVPIFCTSRWSI